MPFIKFHKPWKFAHQGIRVEEFAAGDEVDTTDECAAQAIEDGVAKPVKPPKAAPAPAPAADPQPDTPPAE